MSTITLRLVKGTPLTNAELDANFSNLNTDKLELGGTYSTGTGSQVLFLNASKTLSGSANLTFDGTILSAGRFSGPVTGAVGDLTANSGAFTTLSASSTTTLSAALTYGGVTLANTVTGTGSMVLSISPTLTGTVNTATLNAATFTATADSAFTSTGALRISKGTTLEQPGSPVTGMMRYNSSTNQFEGYSGASPAWKSIGGSALSNDTATATDLYPVFAGATTGTAENLYTSNAQYLFKPSTGELSVKAPRASNGILVNSISVGSNYTIATGDNGLSAGPVSVASGVTVTISSGSVWTVV